MIKLMDIIPTQNELRSVKTVNYFIDKLEKGETFEPVILKQLDDQKYYVHDGAHRLYASWLFGLEELKQSMYIMKYYTYEQFLSVNFRLGWITPFDLRTQCRVPDLTKYKDEIRRKLDGGVPLDEIEKFIRLNGHKYIQQRRAYNISQMELPQE